VAGRFARHDLVALSGRGQGNQTRRATHRARIADAQFIYLGQFGDTFGPGKHTLTTDNIPILATLKGWKYGFESPFKADVYFVNTRLFTGNKWGTANPIMMRDADFGIVRARATASTISRSWT
jgi:membrane protease subunit (stomatin/prohibitin family)